MISIQKKDLNLREITNKGLPIVLGIGDREISVNPESRFFSL
jgi:hypothetical protein